ncbi:hypothetical protein L0152_25280 [bacterium]|nr:hypothetical protein [bacterium]
MRILFLIVFLFKVAAGVFADNGFYLGDLSWPEAKVRIRQVPIVILPFGAGAYQPGMYSNDPSDPNYSETGISGDAQKQQ